MRKLSILFTDLADPSEAAAARRAMKADAAFHVLWDTAQEIFRPARKHGYPDTELNKLLEDNEAVHVAIGMLEEKFYSLMAEQDINLDQDWE